MLKMIGTFQVFIFFCFFALERWLPARNLKRADNFYLWVIAVNAFAIAWFSYFFVLWGDMPQGVVQLNFGVVEGAIFFYCFWSFVGYWWHRLRHANTFLWQNVHKFHHSPPRMECAVAFFKHPFEYASNAIIISCVVWFFSLPVEAVVIGLTIEGTLEVFHHSNIKIPKKFRIIGYIIQTPEMHLVHHQRGLHKYNYATFLWDTVFGTVYIPQEWEGKQGFKTGYDIKGHFFLKN